MFDFGLYTQVSDSGPHGPLVYFFFVIPERDSRRKKTALNRTDNTPCPKLATKIKAFQSAFEVKDLAAYGTHRQVTLLTYRPDMTLDVYRGRKTTMQPF